MPVYKWEEDKDEILEKVSVPSTLKLVVKTVDAAVLLAGWIEHHKYIVGLENLIIADNGSTDPATLELYDKVCDFATVFRFLGPHNQIHWHPRFSDLFLALRRHCDYCSFVDDDERLVQISNTSWVANNSILTQLASCNDQAIVPTTWLINTLNSVTTFSLLDSEGSPRLYNNLKWGKPILPSNLIGIQPGMHNVQFQQRQFSAFFGTSFFLLHLTQFPEQRIAVNRKKLLSNGFVESGLTNQEIMKLDLANPIAMRFIVEMRAMHRIIRGDPPPADHTLTGNLTLEPNGRISYSNANADFGFSSFLQKGPTLIASLSAGEEALATESDDAVALLTHALERRGQGDGDRAERLLLLGLSLYPDFLDQYAMPAFRKELIRTYLARRQWSKAEELAPKNGDAVAETWHYVLFARAFSQAGDDQAAYNWWNLVLDQSPNNREAMDAVGRECHRDTQPRA